jgi:hypothetical protein
MHDIYVYQNQLRRNKCISRIEERYGSI